MTMKTVGIVADDWKVPFFKTALKNGGYQYEQFAGPMHGCTMFKVMTDDVDKLAAVIKRAASSAFKSKKYH